jgi:fructose-1,6-bisphosphatase/inositol monophosphatase family enzyme
MIEVDSKEIEKIIREVAAAEVLPHFNKLKEDEIREKGPGDLVTIADVAAERELAARLARALPGSVVVGEEAVSKNPAVLDRFKGDKPVWVIDPIDGTRNFSEGNKKFGIMVSLVQNGETLYAWAFDAPGNRMATAKKGAGAFLDGQPVKIGSKATELKQLAGRGAGAKGAWNFKGHRDQRSSLHDFMDVLTGAADFFVQGPRVTPWDHGAISLIASEAGAHVAMNKADKPYDPTLLGRAFLLIAATRDLWQKIYPLVNPPPPPPAKPFKLG